MPKTITKEHNIWYSWLDILSQLCTNLWFLYRNISEKDYWIDWEIEILNIWNQLWHKFQLQIKSSQSFSVKNWENFVREITRDDLEYWNREINIPVFIFAVEISTQKVFWCDTRKYYEKIRKNKKQKYINVFTDINNELNLSNKKKFIDFTNELNIFNSNKELMKSSDIEKLRILWKEKWYRVLEQKIENKNILELYNTNNSLKNPISWKFLIENSISDTEFKVSNFNLKIWNEDVFQIDNWIIKLVPYLEKIDIYLKTNNYEYKIIVNKEITKEKVIFSSVDWQLLNIKISINLTKKEKWSFNIKYDFSKLNNVGDYYYLNEFLKEGINWISVSIVGNNWMKVDIMKWTLNFLISKDEKFYIDLIELLYLVENKLKVSFPLKEIFWWWITYLDISKAIPFLKAIAYWKYKQKAKTNINIKLLNLEKTNFQDWEQYFRNVFNGIFIFWIKLPVNVIVEWKGNMKIIWDNCFIESEEVDFYLD